MGRAPPPTHERGAALVLALLIVSLMSITPVSVLDTMRLGIRVSTNLAEREQARLYALGAEKLAAASIAGLREGDRTRYPELDAWTRAPFRYPIPEGLMTGRVRDGANCFNLNALVRPVEQGRYETDPVEVARFAFLLEGIGVARGEAEALTHAIADWIDSDQRPGFGGGEDEPYTALSDPYRAPNQFMVDISELRLVRGVTPALAETLGEFACVRATDEQNALNLNTLEPWQTPLLAAYLGPEHDRLAAEDVLAQRPVGGFSSGDEVFALSVVAQPPVPEANRDLFAVTSRSYELRIRVTYKGAQVGLTSRIAITPDGQVRAAARRFGSVE